MQTFESIETGAQLPSAHESGLCETVSRENEFVGNAGLGSTMPGIADDTEICFRPGAVQVPGATHRAGHVLTALHNHRRYVTDAVQVLQQLAFMLEETAVEKIMTLDARHGQRVLVLIPDGESAFVQ